MSVGRPRLLSNAELSRARALVRSGSPTSVVAAHFDVSYRTMRRRLYVAYKQQERRW